MVLISGLFVCSSLCLPVSQSVCITEILFGSDWGKEFSQKAGSYLYSVLQNWSGS